MKGLGEDWQTWCGSPQGKSRNIIHGETIVKGEESVFFLPTKDSWVGLGAEQSLLVELRLLGESLNPKVIMSSELFFFFVMAFFFPLTIFFKYQISTMKKVKLTEISSTKDDHC